MRLNLRMITLIAFSVLILVFAILIRWVLPPEKAVKKIQERLGTNVISAVQKRLNSIEDQKATLDESSRSKRLLKVEGISRALLGRDNPFEPLSEVPKNWIPLTPPPESKEIVRASTPATTTRSTRRTSGGGSRSPSTSSKKVKEISPPKIELKGILLGTPKMAILDVDGSTVILAEGESLGDIRMASVEGDKVTLSYRSKKISLKMQEIPIQQVKEK